MQRAFTALLAGLMIALAGCSTSGGTGNIAGTYSASARPPVAERSGEMPAVYGDTVHGEYWQNADTTKAKNAGVWYGIIGEPFGEDR